MTIGSHGKKLLAPINVHGRDFRKELTPDGGMPLGSISTGHLGMGTEGCPASHFKYVGLAALQAWTQSRVIMSTILPKADMCGALACVR